MTPGRPGMMHDHWQQLWRLHFAEARRRYADVNIEKLQRRVTKAMEEAYGPCPPKKPDPLPWWAKLGLKIIKRKVEAVKWDWKKSLKKGLRSAGMAALVMAVLVFLGAMDTPDELMGFGVPQQFAAVIAMGVAFLISWLRNYVKINYPGLVPKISKKGGQGL